MSGLFLASSAMAVGYNTSVKLVTRWYKVVFFMDKHRHKDSSTV